MQCVVIEVANYVSEYFLFIANCLNPIVLCLGPAFCLLLAHFNMLAIYEPYYNSLLKIQEWMQANKPHPTKYNYKVSNIEYETSNLKYQALQL